MSEVDIMMLDTLARDKIVTGLSSNFFVEAGAGSGKTTILVKRMVAMVEAGMDVSKICAITFTKAAAGEFYDRFQKKLIERSNAPTKADFVREEGELDNPTDVTRERCQKALQNIDLCFMGTIDSFCNMVLSEHPAEAMIPSSAMVIDEDEAGKFYKREYSRIQKGLYGNELREKCRYFQEMNYQADKLFLAGIKTLMEHRNSELMISDLKDANIDQFFGSSKTAFVGMLKTLIENEKDIRFGGSAKESTKAWDTLNNKQRILLGNWHDHASEIGGMLKAMEGLRLAPSADPAKWGMDEFFEAHYTKTKLTWYEIDKDHLETMITSIKNILSSIAIDFIHDCVPVIEESLRKEGALTFFDYLLYLRDMLKDDIAKGGRLVRHIYERHSYFLIDEFQDTNPMQAEIFFYLTAKDPVVEWRKCIPQGGSLFIVGDPKQSIYRFRSADVASYLKVKELFQGNVGEVVYLTRNFRSSRRMRSWFNDVFSNLLPETVDEQCKYELIPLEPATVSPDRGFQGVYKYESVSGTKADPEDMDQGKIAKIIQQIVHNPGYMIPESPDKALREITYKDIMIITPTKAGLGKCMKMFTEKGIPFKVEGKVLFEDSPSLIETVKVFDLAADPTSPYALYGALTSKLIGWDDNKILSLKNRGINLSIFEKSDLLDEEEQKVFKLLKTLSYAAISMPAAALFSKIMEEFRVFEKVGAYNMEYVYYAMELIRDAEAQGTISSTKDAAKFLHELIEGETEIERSISLMRSMDKVHIANLHKVKGLEAPIVILGAPTKKERKPGIRVEQREDGSTCWLFQISGDHSVYLEDGSFTVEIEKEIVSQGYEAERLLYVAATRAKHVLLVGRSLNSKGESPNNPWEYFHNYSDGDFFDLDRGTPEMITPEAGQSITDLYDQAAGNVFEGATSKEKSHEIKRPSMIKVKGKSSEEDDFADVTSTEVRTHEVRKDAAIVGTMVHRIMEVLVSSKNKVDLDKLVKETAMEYESKETRYVDLLKKVGETIRSGGFDQENDAPKDILSELLSAEQVYCELPFCYKDGIDIWNGIMDVVYCKQGKWHIVDYKTNADPSDLDEKYQSQLEAYKKAFKEMSGEEADAVIYHIDV